MVIAQAEDTEAARAEMGAALERLMAGSADGLREARYS